MAAAAAAIRAGTDSSLELGRERTFDYALVPHAGDWGQAGVYRDGLGFNHPLMAQTLAAHPGQLPKALGFPGHLSPERRGLRLKPGPGGTVVVRVYEAAGEPTAAKIRLSVPVAAAEEVNLMEDPGRKLAVADNSLQINLHPFEIKTLKLKLLSLKGN